MRGFAALLVCAGHLRAFLLVDSVQIHTANILVMPLYFLTGFGHQAVIVFFVLSGFFVGGGVVKLFSQNKWSWKQYVLRRLTRLWIVLLPALLLTLLFDLIGQHLAPAEYQGIFHNLYHSGPALDAPADLGFRVFLGNVFFLQTIVTPVFGTNDPLWSLANEFWYYLLFPLLLAGFKAPNWTAKMMFLGMAIGVLVWLPKPVLFLGLIWLLGVMVYLAVQKESVKKQVSQKWFLVPAVCLALGSLFLTKARLAWLETDYFIGGAFALLIASLAAKNHVSRAYASVANALGETTYTLYLTHFSFLVFIFFTSFKGHKLQPDLLGMLSFLGVLIGTVIYTTMIWWCFERNTELIRKRIEAKLSS